MNFDLLFSGGAVFLLLLVSAFFSGSETSVTGSSMLRMHTLAQQGNHRAMLVKKLWDDKESLIGAILLGNNFVNILASSLATSILIQFFGQAGIAYATFGMTMLVVIFAEIMPKTYALNQPDSTALRVAPILRLTVLVLSPLTKSVQFVTRGIFRLAGYTGGTDSGGNRVEEELRGAIDLHAGEGAEERRRGDMLRSILDLVDVEVGEVLTHRNKVVLIDVDNPPEDIVQAVLNSPHTRIPLYQNEPDNIVGVLHAKALLRALHESGGEAIKINVMDVASDPWFVPGSTDLLSQLEAFRERHEHFAIVIDEYGGMMGIVTLEDILEEIVGEISDELDIEIPGVRAQRDGSLIVDGDVTIRDLNREFDWRLPDEAASTLAGLLLDEAQRIPEVGQVFLFHGHRFEILERERNRVTKIGISPMVETGKKAGSKAAGNAAGNSADKPADRN
jgi:Mg2+/Co2+ transporter CorB